MKKILTKQFSIKFVSIAILLIIAMISCKKNDELTNKPENLHRAGAYNQTLFDSFLNTQIAIDFINEVNGIPINVNNGIMVLNSVEDYNALYDLLVQYSDMLDLLVENDSVNYAKYALEEIPESIILQLFEYHIGIYTLRSKIEDQLILLQQGSGIPENNDPDDHYIISPFERTLLSSKCEIIVDDLICVVLDNYTVGIMNYDWSTLDELHQIQNPKIKFDELLANEFCSTKPNAFILSFDAEPSVNVDFTYTRSGKNLEDFKFVNNSFSEAYKELVYLWDFGDGTTSNIKNPTHSFNFARTPSPNVTLTVSLDRRGMVGESGIVVDDNEDPVFTATPSNSGTGIVSFTCTYPEQSNVGKYVWNFGDGSSTQTTLDKTVSHTYVLKGTYTVNLTVYNTDNTIFGYAQKSVTVSSVKNCCEKNARNASKVDYTHNGETRRMKFTIRVSNSWLIHRMVSKTKHMKKNAQGCWVLKNADEINTGFFGCIYSPASGSNECGTPSCFDIFKREDRNGKNRPQMVWDYSVGMDDNAIFTVSKESLSSLNFIKTDGVVRYSGLGASVHKKACD